MTQFDNQDSTYWKKIFGRLTLISICILLIVWFLPRNEEHQYRYDVGMPWTYGTFIAKFEFPIYKTEEAIKAEQDSLLKFFQPYYRYNPRIENEAIKQFREDYKNGIPGLPKAYINTIADRLHRLYQAGIMSTPEYNKIGKDSTMMVRIITNKEAQSIQIGCIYSTIGAYEKLFMDGQLAPQRQILQRCNLNDYIEPNLTYDKERSITEKNDLLSGVACASGVVKSGQKIIDRGEIVDDYTYRVLSSFEQEMKKRNDNNDESFYSLLGQIIFVTIMILLFSTYLALFRKDYFDKPRSLLMLYALITIFPILVSIMVRHNFFSIYILPFAMAPMFVRIFMDSRTAFTTHAIMIIICTAAVKYQYEFIIVQLIAGMVAILSLKELASRAQVFKTSLFTAIVSAVVYFALQLMQENDITKISRSMYVYFALNGILMLLAYPLMYIIEKTFGFTSNVTLFELSNTNTGILRTMSEVAPGTFQHSITVGNLASEIARKIGADSLLVRTGALYHDIGKILNPSFFTENQVGGNPHIGMDEKESAQIIISHVTEGIKMAEREGLPTIIKDFILTHHGRGMVKYFYITYKNKHPEEEVDTEPFTYPGPDPSTREQAILMMSDAVEAASRSLQKYTEENISNLVNKLIDTQFEEGHFKDCPITFRDIAMAKFVLVDRLKTIYHTRIQYPELNKKASKK